MSNNNNVTLLGFYGSDKTHALSAWQSTNVELGVELPEEVSERIAILFEETVKGKKKSLSELLSMLAKHGHHTPFEKSALHFQITGDIASHIHCLKHRIGVSINSECLTGDSVITFTGPNGHTAPSKKKTIKELYDLWSEGRKHQKTEKDREYVRERIKSRNLRVLDEKSGFFTTGHIKDIWEKGVQDVYLVSLENGKSLKVTDNHQIFTPEGFRTISQGLKKGDLVGCNGKVRPWIDPSFFKGSENLTRKEFATLTGVKYSTIKKWGYIHDITFKVDENKDFKKGNVPWNLGKAGTYSLNISEEGLKARAAAVKRGSESHFWRGGVTSEGSKIGVWTRKVAREVHRKFNGICQYCEKRAKNAHAHHIIPVYADESKAYDFDNLVTVCQKCHVEIHKNPQNEWDFALKVLGREPVLTWDDSDKKPRGRGKLSVDFSPIVSIVYVGKEMTYDIEVEGDKNNNFVANGIVVHNSARYKELKDKWYVPEDWSTSDRPAVTDEMFAIGIDSRYSFTWADVLDKYSILGHKLYHQATEQLTPTLGRKRAKESARYFLPYSKQLDYDMMFNFRSFAHFVKLRGDSHAQREIQKISHQMVDAVASLPGNPFKESLEAFDLV